LSCAIDNSLSEITFAKILNLHALVGFMKKLCSNLALAFSLVPASAIPLYDGFEYDNSSNTNLIGRIDTRDSIQWFQAAPDASLTNQPYIIPGSLDYPGRPPGKGNRVGMGGNGAAVRFSFKDTDVGLTGTLYYSFLLKVRDVSSLNTSGVYWAAYNNTQGSQTTVPSAVTARLQTKKDPSNLDNYMLGIVKNSGTTSDFTFATNSLTTNEVVLVVVGLTFTGDKDSSDFVQLWVNPDASTFGGATPPPAGATNTAGGDLGNVRSFVLFNRAPSAATPKLELDELLIGNNWADVTPRTNDMLAIAPKSQTVLAGSNVYLDTRSQMADSWQWRFNGIEIPGATGRSLPITNLQSAYAGTYSVVYSNAAGTSISNAIVAVASGPALGFSPLWSLAPGDRPYLTIDTSSVTDQRSLAYYAPSNQVYIVSMTNSVTGASTGQVYVLDGTTGADLHQLDSDGSVISSATTNSGNRPILSIDVSEDGVIYAGNLTDNAGPSGRPFNLYLWTNSESSTPPRKVFGSVTLVAESTQHRWGDTLVVRNMGAGTEVALDEDTGMYGLVLTPTDGSLTAFASQNGSFGFFQSKPRPSLSRSLQFGPTNSIWQKPRSVQYAGAGPLQKWVYDTSTVHGPSTLETSLDVFSSDLGPVAVDFAQKLLAGLSFTPISGTPDSVALYDISDISNPVLLTRYNFPINHQSNGSFGKVTISGDRVYAINANNGVLALAIVPVLSIVPSGSDMLLSWTTNAPGYTLQAAPSLLPSATWTNVGAGTVVGDKYFVTNGALDAVSFYRLKK
jgi:hypothetical protein